MAIQPVTVERDEYGYWLHPDIPWDDFPEGTDMVPPLKALGFLPRFVSMEDDASDEINQRYLDGEGDVTDWEPKTPEDGDGWFLAAIYDTENGPQALWLRPLVA